MTFAAPAKGDGGLLVAERYHGVDSHRAARGKQAPEGGRR
jgi:hypothetical protein